MLAEDVRVVAFRSSPENAEWLDSDAAEDLLSAEPDKNIAPEQASEFVEKVIARFDTLRPHLDKVAFQRGDELLDAHQRVRRASKVRTSSRISYGNVQYRVEPQLPPDVLGIYVYLPKV